MSVERSAGPRRIAAVVGHLLGLHQGKLKEAFQIIEQSLSRCEERSPLLMIHGELLLEAGLYSEAREAFQQGTDDPMTLYKRFRGAEPKIQPLLKRRGLI